MDVPDDLRYTADHEWVRLEGDSIRIGITDYAQDALGDVVFVQMPEVGATMAAGDPVGEVESTKSVSDVYVPLAGTVTEVNEAATESPERVNQDPYGDGWLCVIRLDQPAAVGSLLDAAAYRKLIED